MPSPSILNNCTQYQMAYNGKCEQGIFNVLFVPIHTLNVRRFCKAKSDVSPDFKIAMFFLLSFSPKKVAYYTQADIMKATGVSRTSVATGVKNLTAAGFLFAKEKARGTPGLTYCLNRVYIYPMNKWGAEA